MNEAPQAQPPAREDRPASLAKLARFLLVGGSATALHYLLALALLRWAGWPAVLASSCGFVLSAVFNYALNAAFTFRARLLDARAMLRFALVAGSGCALNALALLCLQALGWGLVPAQLAATIAVLAWNFLLSAYWTFRKRPPASF